MPKPASSAKIDASAAEDSRQVAALVAGLAALRSYADKFVTAGALEHRGRCAAPCADLGHGRGLPLDLFKQRYESRILSGHVQC